MENVEEHWKGRHLAMPLGSVQRLDLAVDLGSFPKVLSFSTLRMHSVFGRLSILGLGVGAQPPSLVSTAGCRTSRELDPELLDTPLASHATEHLTRELTQFPMRSAVIPNAF